MPSLSVLLAPEHVLEIDAHTREEALRALADHASQSLTVQSDELLRAILEREELASTGFGGGVAMPHVRLAGARRFTLALGRLREGVEFAAVDGQPVRLLLLIVGPQAEKERYQKVMARAAKFLKAEGPRLIAADDLQATVGEALPEY